MPERFRMSTNQFTNNDGQHERRLEISGKGEVFVEQEGRTHGE